MRNFRLELSYDGTRYKGWQKLGDTDNTIQSKVEATLSRLLGQSVELAASGRTDAGVHARQQVCSFRAETEMPCEALLSALRSYLPKDIGALSLTDAPERFHARYNCREKTYVYRVRTCETPDVFSRAYVYAFPEKLDTDAMRLAADALTGEHDFSAFTTAKRMKKSAVRTLREIRFEETEGELRMVFTGDGFLYNMVRILVGTLLEVGTGRRPAASVPEIFASRTRENAGFTAPACGLTLWEVRY